jgi:hypothetical protein
MANVEVFRNNIIEAGVLDAEGTHHEFVSGMHGQKLDFDTIPTGSDLYYEWITTSADFLQENFPQLPRVILGVANGTNRVAHSLGLHFGGEVLGFASAKDSQDSKQLYLPHVVEQTVKMEQPALVVVIEDVGTTGSNSVQVAQAAKAAGAQAVEVVTTWKRREHLERLEEAGIPYRAIIDEPLTTYTPEECETLEYGFYRQGWDFIPRG